LFAFPTTFGFGHLAQCLQNNVAGLGENAMWHKRSQPIAT
jgi:hypothetical protein